MKNKSEQISSTQLMFSVGCFIQACTLLTYGIYSFVKQEAWIVVVTGYAVCLPIIWIYISLAKRFPGKSLIEIDNIVLGKILGSIFSVLYIFYFLTLVFLNARDVGNFVGGYMLPTTPMPVVLSMFIFICCWAVRKGVQTMTRYGTLFVIITLIVFLTNSLLLIKNIKLDNFLPLFSMPLKNYLEGIHTLAMLPVCEIMAFLMLIPGLKNAKESGKVFWGGSAIGIITLFLVVIRDTAVLGPLTSVVSNPSFAVIRLINIGNILTRMDVLYAVVLIMLLFFKTTVLFYAAVSGASRLLKLDSYKFLAPSFGVIIVIFASAIFDSAMEHANWCTTGAAAVYATFFLLIMPAVTIVVAAVRGLIWKRR